MATQAATGRPHLRLLSGECGSVDVQARLARAIDEGRDRDAARLLRRLRKLTRRPAPCS